ncbi:MAG: hypothetical protein ABI615_10665 [Chthoniobacterales bacterium]
MFKRHKFAILPLITFGIAIGAVCPVTAQEATGTLTETVISFAPGKWDPAQWTPLRLPNQEQAVKFVQNPDSIGTTKESFDKTDYSKERDNALLVYDMGTTEGEIAVTLRIGTGFNNFSSPGICLFPKIKDGTFESGIAVFVATYTMAIWYEYAEGNVMKYKHMGQVTRWSDPDKKHILRCRFSKKSDSIAISLDDAPPLVFQYVSNTRLSNINHEINPLVALWGCHGVCDFYEMKIINATKAPKDESLLPFILLKNPKK